jgi:hypothetical protein
MADQSRADRVVGPPGEVTIVPPQRFATLEVGMRVEFEPESGPTGLRTATITVTPLKTPPIRSCQELAGYFHRHVERFMGQADAAVKLTEFQKGASWQQYHLIEQGGWATATGSKDPNAAVARACAQQLAHINT